MEGLVLRMLRQLFLKEVQPNKRNKINSGLSIRFQIAENMQLAGPSCSCGELFYPLDSANEFPNT